MKPANILILILVVGMVRVLFSQQTSDGGYILGGTSQSYSHGGGIDDFLVYKVDADGVKQWRKNYGGTISERCYAAEQTTDGGYILAGFGNSSSHGFYDFLVYKVDAAGNKQWRKYYGGINYDLCYSAQQTADGGYILAGDSATYTHGGNDFIAYKIDADGAKQWRKNYGGMTTDNGKFIRQTSDGGYIFAGYGDSYTNGQYDALVYKLDAAGNKQWRKNFGGGGYDYCRCIRQTSDGGYIFIGQTDSFGVDGNDFLVYKVDAAGVKQWRKTYGGAGHDKGYGLWVCADGGYALIGITSSYTHGMDDMLVYKVDAGGVKQWRKNYGGDKNDLGFVIQQTPDGGYILLGSTYTYTNGSCDFLVYKVDSAGTKQWRKNYGGSSSDYIYFYK